MVKVISIEGSIGAGKSTLIDGLIKRHENNFILIPEPVEEWKSIMIGDKNILECFYQDMKNVALPFQLIALITRRQIFNQKLEEAKNLEKELGSEVYLITERTVFSDKHIFANMLHSDGFITDVGMVAYDMWNKIFSEECKIYKTIYLTTEPDVCMKRIKIRNRKGEDKITLEYLEECQRAHDKFYDEHLSKTDCMSFTTENSDIGTSSYEELLEHVISYINN